LDLLRGGDSLRPVEDFLDAALAQLLGDVGGMQFPHLAEIEVSVDLLPPLEEVVLLVLHHALPLLLLLGLALLLLGLGLVLPLEEVGDDGVGVCSGEWAGDERGDEFADGDHTTKIVIE
jgi:hypothetical protein